MITEVKVDPTLKNLFAVHNAKGELMYLGDDAIIASVVAATEAAQAFTVRTEHDAEAIRAELERLKYR